MLPRYFIGCRPHRHRLLRRLHHPRPHHRHPMIPATTTAVITVTTETVIITTIIMTTRPILTRYGDLVMPSGKGS